VAARCKRLAEKWTRRSREDIAGHYREEEELWRAGHAMHERSPSGMRRGARELSQRPSFDPALERSKDLIRKEWEEQEGLRMSARV
jgi:hypothetical protein